MAFYMKHSLLVTRPNSDRTTRYISTWAEKVISLAQEKGLAVFDLARNRANRKELESMIRRNEPSLIFLNGHGHDTVVTGQDGEVLIEAGSNENILKKRIVYALSCRSGKVLGPRCVQAGTEAYIGYDEDFIFLFEESKRTHPEQDKTAELFLTPSNQVVISLLKGHSAEEAHANSKRSFVRNIKKLLSSQTSSSDSQAVRYLIWDMQHQVCLGN